LNEISGEIIRGQSSDLLKTQIDKVIEDSYTGMSQLESSRNEENKHERLVFYSQLNFCLG
jgi:hypothetical protein